MSGVSDLAERQNALRLFREWMQAVDALVVAQMCGECGDAIDELEEAANEAQRAYDDCGVELQCDYGDEPFICAATGAPIQVGDDTVLDPRTNQISLRCA